MELFKHSRSLKKFFINRVYISIIMPVYNVEKYLRECLDSLLNQTFKEIEIICIDDGSTDESYNILCEYQAKNKIIKVYQQEHSNAGDARNIGIKHAKGKYLLFLDSDDFFEENLCQTAYDYTKDSKVDILFYNAFKYNEENGQKEEFITLLNTEYTPLNTVFNPDDVKEHLYHITSAAPWSKMFRKSFIKKNHLQFQALTNANDVYFTRISLVLAKKMYAINEPLVNYRYNHGNNSQTNKYKDPLAFIRAYLKVKETLENRNLFNKYYQTYMNVLISEITYNYNSTQTKDAKDAILNYLKNGGLKELGIEKIDEDLVYVNQKYDNYKKILNEE